MPLATELVATSWTTKCFEIHLAWPHQLQANDDVRYAADNPKAWMNGKSCKANQTSNWNRSHAKVKASPHPAIRRPV